MAFETFKGLMGLWWDLYIVWIQLIQLKIVQVMFVGYIQKFTQLWQQKDSPNKDDALQQHMSNLLRYIKDYYNGWIACSSSIPRYQL